MISIHGKLMGVAMVLALGAGCAVDEEVDMDATELDEESVDSTMEALEESERGGFAAQAQVGQMGPSKLGLPHKGEFVPSKGEYPSKGAYPSKGELAPSKYPSKGEYPSKGGYVGQHGEAQIGKAELGQAQIGQAQIGKAEIGQAQIGQAQIGHAQVSKGELVSTQVGKGGLVGTQVGQAGLVGAQSGLVTQEADQVRDGSRSCGFGGGFFPGFLGGGLGCGFGGGALVSSFTNCTTAVIPFGGFGCGGFGGGWF